MSKRDRYRDRIRPKDGSCECLDECVKSANLAPTNNVISVLNKSFVDCYIRCSEYCKDADYVSSFSGKVSKILMNVYRCESVKLKQLLKCTSEYFDNLLKAVTQVFPTVFEFKAKSVSRIVVHCSSRHLPLQVSLAWDPVLNVPYIPSSSIKGIVRSYFEENNIGLDGLGPDELFGTTEHQGGLVFFNVYPVSCTGNYLVEADVITPHYRELEELIDEVRSSPTPIVFPVISGNVELRIIVALEKSLNKKLSSNTISTTLVKNITEALEKGLGAKTSVGYGRIKVLSTSRSGALEKTVEGQAKL